MTGDGKWRTLSVGSGPRPFVVWRVVDGRTEYHKTIPCNYGPSGRTIRFTFQGARDKARELNGLFTDEVP